MSQQDSANRPGVAVRKQGFSIYTVMLLISFFAIMTACIVLWLHLRTYGDFPYWTIK